VKDSIRFEQEAKKQRAKQLLPEQDLPGVSEFRSTRLWNDESNQSSRIEAKVRTSFARE